MQENSWWGKWMFFEVFVKAFDEHRSLAIVRIAILQAKGHASCSTADSLFDMGISAGADDVSSAESTAADVEALPR
jgi:hypothetical protein